jgi:hypothetical protein
MTESANERLINELDTFAAELLQDVRGHIRGEDAPSDEAIKIGFTEKLKTFDSIARWVATRNKIDPDEAIDEFARQRSKVVGGTRRRGSAGA